MTDEFLVDSNPSVEPQLPDAPAAIPVEVIPSENMVSAESVEESAEPSLGVTRMEAALVQVMVMRMPQLL